MLDSFSKKQLEAVVRLTPDEDFQEIFKFIEDSITGISLKSVNYAGIEGERIKGACLCMIEFRDMLKAARLILDRYRDAEEEEALERDPVSP